MVRFRVVPQSIRVQWSYNFREGELLRFNMNTGEYVLTYEFDVHVACEFALAPADSQCRQLSEIHSGTALHLTPDDALRVCEVCAGPIFAPLSRRRPYPRLPSRRAVESSVPASPQPVSLPAPLQDGSVSSSAVPACRLVGRVVKKSASKRPPKGLRI